MLTNLSIKNYALIENLTVQFKDQLSIITGETGAGKSILLGALGLVLGNRADSTTLKNKEQKCIIEAEFNLVNYEMFSFFDEFQGLGNGDKSYQEGHGHFGFQPVGNGQQQVNQDDDKG